MINDSVKKEIVDVLKSKIKIHLNEAYAIAEYMTDTIGENGIDTLNEYFNCVIQGVAITSDAKDNFFDEDEDTLDNNTGVNLVTGAPIVAPSKKKTVSRVENLFIEDLEDPKKHSKYIGVSKYLREGGVSRNRWYARTEHRGKKYYLGAFSTEEEAAFAYDKFCFKIKRYDKINFPERFKTGNNGVSLKDFLSQI